MILGQQAVGGGYRKSATLCCLTGRLAVRNVTKAAFATINKVVYGKMQETAQERM